MQISFFIMLMYLSAVLQNFVICYNSLKVKKNHFCGACVYLSRSYDCTQEINMRVLFCKKVFTVGTCVNLNLIFLGKDGKKCRPITMF